MITEDYVSFEIAKLLKEKGFDEKCTHYYKNEKYLVDLGYTNIHSYTNSNLVEEYAAPTLQMAMKWLREMHHITIGITFSLDIITYEIHKDKKFIIAVGSSRSYENMIEEAIKCCLENLV